MPRSGVRSLFALLLSGCLYSLSGGGGLPPGIKTVAVIPFENETAASGLPTELQLELRKEFLSRFGLREAPEGKASAVIHGTIKKYEPDIAVGYSADPAQATSARRRLQISIDVEIVDNTGRTIFKRAGLSAEGEYAERAEDTGRKQAIQRLVSDIIEGAQSQW
jgi:Lipopolysaccharide-assembly